MDERTAERPAEPAQAETCPAEPQGDDAPGSRNRAPRPRSLPYAVAGVALAAVLAVVLFVGIGKGGGTPDVAPGIDAAAANLFQLDALSPHEQYLAADFTLTDQHGRRVSLSQFRGKAVVLSFNDDRCTDLCTLLAQDIVVADRDLGAAAKDVVFLSVNANPFYPGISSISAWTDEHGLGSEPNWVYVTGPVDRLKATWRQYGAYVGLDYRNRTVVHSTELFFIDPSGREAAVGQFGTNAANTSLWSHVMAQMADDLLPGTQQVPVGGPSVPAPTSTNAAVGAPAPSFSLPLLASGHGTLSSSDLRGRYAVLSFWASTCTACRQEMPHVEQAYRHLGRKVAFVGVDVSDRQSSASGFARAVGATYPLVADAQGTLAGAYRLPGLPFTVIVGPHGEVLTRHPGSLTSEQLEYLLQSEDPALDAS